MTVISIFNQKGGVGKTTTVVNLSVGLSKLGKKVLVIDLDPQANATTGLGLDRGECENSTYNLFYEDDLEKVPSYIKKTEEGVDLIASENALSGLEVELVSLDEEERVKQLSYFLEDLRKLYDFIFIDCPPSLGLLSINALAASDSLIIPIQCEYYALEGVSELLNTYSLVRDSINPDLKIEGVLLSMFDENIDLSIEVLEEVKKFFKGKVFSTMIPRNVKLAEAPSFGKSIFSYDKGSQGARAYDRLAEELLKRIDKEAGPGINEGQNKEKDEPKKEAKEKEEQAKALEEYIEKYSEVNKGD